MQTQSYPKFINRNYCNELTLELNELSSEYSKKLHSYPTQRDADWHMCSSGILSERDLVNVYAKVTEIPIIKAKDLDKIELFKEISFEYISNWCCLPYKWDDDNIEMLVTDPYGLQGMIYYFKNFYNKNLSFTLIRRSSLDKKINELYLHEDNSEETDDFVNMGDSEEALRNLATEAKIVRFVNEIFSRAVEMDASDIHIEPEETQLAIRFRIDGMLQEIMNAPLVQYPAIASRIKLIAGLNIAESRLPQDGRTDFKLGRSELDIRISSVPTMNGESIVMRLLRKDGMEFNLISTGMLPEMVEKFKNIINTPNGIILTVGPTGSGKSTTLYSIMSTLNTPDKKIITIEDPVEYRIERLSQIQVNPKIGLDFASGLRNIVRQDPDIILVGEIRDRETADIAINAALTGHLVLSTLHTNDAAGAVSRLLDMGIDGFLISSALTAVLSQRLVRKICDKCHGNKNSSEICEKCADSGFKGRAGIFELLVVNDEIREAINNNSDSNTIAKLAIKNGMIPLVDDGNKKVQLGITTETEIRRNTVI